MRALRHRPRGNLAGTALQARRATAPEDGGLGHEVKVKEFDQLELDLARGATLLEKGCHREKTIEVFEGASVGRAVQQRRNEGEEGSRLNGRAVDRVEQIEEKVHVDLAGEESARRRVQQQGALDQIESADDEHVVGAITAPAEQVFEAGDETHGN